MMWFGPTSHSFISQRSRLHYVDWGNPDAPLLILMHGNRDHCRSWDWVAEQLCGDWHVVAPDLRGHGDSNWSPEGRYDFSGNVYDLAQLVFELGGQRATIMAHSMGSHIALRYAGIFPDNVAKLIAVEAVGAPREMEAEFKKLTPAMRYHHWIEARRSAAGKSPRVYASIEAAQRRMQSENVWLTDTQAQHLTVHGIRRTEDGGYCWKFDNCLGLWPAVDHTQEEVFAFWRNITCPTMLIYGTASWQTDMAGQLEEHIRDLYRIDIEGAGHWPHHDNFDRFMQEVRGFL